MEILIFLDGLADEPLIGRVRIRSNIGNVNKSLTFSEKMYCLEKELVSIEQEIKKIDDENENFERVCMNFIYLLSNSAINYQWIDYLIEKEWTIMNKKLLKMFEMHKSVKRRMRKLLSLSVPVTRSIIFYQRTSGPRRKK